MSQVTPGAPLDAARSAFERHAWAEALERFGEADRIAPLAPSDLEPFAETAWWCGQGCYSHKLSAPRRAS